MLDADEGKEEMYFAKAKTACKGSLLLIDNNKVNADEFCSILTIKIG